MEEKVKIEIPKADEKEVANISSGELGDVKKRFERIDQILFGIVIVVVLSLVAIIISTIGLFLDQMRYNSVAYKEYSEKIQTLDFMRESNTTLLNQNKQNQERIIKQNEQILKLHQ